MKTALIAALHEGHGFLQDQGWHQTAQLMTIAANEIERLNERVRELEAKALPDRHMALARPATPSSLVR
jgi:hypothetical protein